MSTPAPAAVSASSATAKAAGVPVAVALSERVAALEAKYDIPARGGVDERALDLLERLSGALESERVRYERLLTAFQEAETTLAICSGHIQTAQGLMSKVTVTNGELRLADAKARGGGLS